MLRGNHIRFLTYLADIQIENDESSSNLLFTLSVLKGEIDFAVLIVIIIKHQFITFFFLDSENKIQPPKNIDGWNLRCHFVRND